MPWSAAPKTPDREPVPLGDDPRSGLHRDYSSGQPFDKSSHTIFSIESAGRGAYRPMNGEDIKPSVSAGGSSGDLGRARSARTALGVFGLIVIIGGSLVSLGVLAFLFYLWLGKGTDDGASSQYVWRRIVVGQALGPTVTIASAILRIIISAQALAGTSLIAAIILERHGVPLAYLAEMSVLRCENSGPIRMVSLMLSSRFFFWNTKLPFILTIILLVGALGSQFTSTLLVSDLGIIPLVGDPTSIPVGNFGNFTNARFDYPLALSFPPAFTPFGEVAGPGNSTPTDRGLSDTGSVQRVYLPLIESNRTTVREYDGQTISFASRFVCMRPKLVGAGVEQIFQNFPGSGVPGLPAFSGKISYQAAFDAVGLSGPANCQGIRCFSSSFNCTLPFSPLEDLPSSLSACIPDRTNTLLTPGFVDTSLNPVQNYSEVVIIVNSNVTDATTHNLKGGFVSLPTDSTSDGEFTTWELNGIKVSASLCFETVGFSMIDAKLSADRDLPSPQAAWDFVDERYILDDPARLLGVSAGSSALTASARGLYSVESTGNTTVPDFLQLLEQGVMLLDTEIFGRSINTLLSPLALGLSTIACGIQNQALFELAMNTTGRPALALQGLLTTMAAVNIGNMIPLLSNFTDARVVPSVLVLAPVQWRGLVAATSFAVVSLAVTAVVTAIFLVQTRYSSLNNYWDAVAQVYSEETRWILDDSAEARNVAVAKTADRKDDVAVRIGRSFSDAGRVQALPHRRTRRT